MKRPIIFLSVIMLSAAIFTGCGSAENTAPAGETPADEAEEETTNAEESTAAEGSEAAAEASEEGITPSHNVTIEVENYGTIKGVLIASQAPETVENFVKLADSGFYDGLTFHRIMSGFMIQGGDPLGNGTGGADENIKGEFYMNGVENKLSHVRGAISMARSQDPDSASSQFFIVHEDSTFLDGQYACFGYVTEGMEVVDKICEDAKPTDDNGTIPADEQPVITSIKVESAE